MRKAKGRQTDEEKEEVTKLICMKENMNERTRINQRTKFRITKSWS